MDTSLDTCFINDNCYNHRNEWDLNYPNRHRETLNKLITIVTIEASDLFNRITNYDYEYYKFAKIKHVIDMFKLGFSIADRE